MRLFRWWLRGTEGIEQAKRADEEADMRLRETRSNARWARTMLNRDGFAEALTHIIQGGHP